MMKRCSIVILTFFLFLLLPHYHIAHAQTTDWVVSSPDAKLSVTLSNISLPAPYVSGQRLYYKVTFNAEDVLEYAPLGLTLADGTVFGSSMSFVSQQSSTINETYPMKFGKKSLAINNANELTITFKTSSNKTIGIVIRAYNDGFAYRYLLPGTGSVAISSEQSSFRIPTGTDTWAMPYTVSYENEYVHYAVSDLVTGEYGFPLLGKTVNNNWFAITEAAVYSTYAGMHLSGSGTNDRIMKLVFPSDQTTAITSPLPFSSPWRVAMIGNLQSLFASTLIENLNPSQEYTDDTWIKPGRVAWSWWSDSQSPKSLTTQEQYVDFASQMGWEYILVDEGWDATWIPQLVSYANSKHVGIILWYFYASFTQWTPSGWVVNETYARNTFNQLQQWGVKGIKLDFLDSESQYRYQFYDQIGKLAGEYKMIVNFHGTTKPTGERRRWPHILTREAVKGAEYKTPNSRHTTTIPFTRNLLGPMDYTPVTFSNTGGTTYTHQLAESVVFESATQHFADSSTSYLSNPAIDFLKTVPTTWDDIRFLDGFPEQFIVLARKKGNDWYIGALNSTTARTVTIPLSFIAGTYTGTMYADTGSTSYTITTQQYSTQDILTLILPANGGAVVKLEAQNISLSPTPTVTLLNGDTNSDGKVDSLDLKQILQNWLSLVTTSIDQYGDGRINALDFVRVVKQIPPITSPQ